MADCDAPETRALYRTMRATRPVFFDERYRSWCVFRYDEARAVLVDHASFSADFAAKAPGSALDRIHQGNLNASDPPRHTRLRALVSKAFSPRSIAELAPEITSTAHALLDELAPRGSCELMEEFAGVLPLLVIGEILGIPRADRAHFRRLTLAFTETFESIVSGAPTDLTAHEAMGGYFARMLAERRAAPRDDLTTRLAEAEVDGERLSDHEVLTFMKLLLIAGNSTTARLVGNAVLTLLEHPEELDRLRREPAQIPSAVEEVLRFRPPINTWFRIAAKDLTLGGEQLRGGDQVAVFLGSANRDEAHFADPDRFDVARDPNPHLAFSGGVHFCLGAPLARLEGQIALRALLDRLPELALAGAPPTPTKGLQANGFAQLPVRWRS